MRRRRPYGDDMRRFIDAWDATDHQGKVILCQNHGITYETGKKWRLLGIDDYPQRPDSVEHRQAERILARRMRPNVPLKLQTRDEPQTFAIFCDTHNPFQDKDALSLAESVLIEHPPDYLVYNGDANDFYQISKFDKNPARVSKLQEDIDDTKAMFERHTHIFPNTKKILLGGNHEDRLERFLWTDAPALSSLRCLTIEELFGLEKFNIEYVPYDYGLLVNGIFLIMHGGISSVHSAYTAKRMYEKHGGCGLCGHCHKAGAFQKRDRFGTWGWWEGGCLCRLDPDWIEHPNWIQGFMLVHFMGKRFWVEQILIVGTPLSIMYGGKLYKLDKNHKDNQKGA
jgi:hypothetical protein